MLLEPGTVTFDLGERIQVAQDREDVAKVTVGALDRAAERLQDLTLHVRARGREDVVLAVVEDGELVAVVVHPPPEPPRRAREDVVLAPAEQGQVVVTVEEVLIAFPGRDEVVC